MYYFSDKPSNSGATMKFNCVRYHHSCTEDRNQRKIAFHHHNHEEIEILVVTEGELRATVNDRKYLLKQGDVVIVNPYRIHYGEWVENHTENEYLCITFNANNWLNFRKSTLYDEKQQLSEGSRCFTEFLSGQEAEPLYRLISELSALFHQKDIASECRSASVLYSLWALLFEKFYCEHTEETSSSRNVKFMTQISRYLSEHYTENISTADAAKSFYMSVPAFCYAFKRSFGVSFLNYLCKYRITRSIELYYEAKLPLSSLAEAVGFNDYCYFSRSFHKCIGTSPSEYFEKAKK